MDTQEREAAEARLAVLEALVAAHDRFGEVVRVIEDALDKDDATDRVMVLLGLPERHLAMAVLDMQLRRRTQRARDRIRTNGDEVRDYLREG